jgi:uncharacterized protein YhbP (UPF0306 family)
MADDRTARARLIVENGAYMTLATADASGAPWVTPVWYALESLSSLIWISRPDARHSQNLSVRPQLGIVIFDSHAPIGTGQGVYLEATAEPVTENEVEATMAVFSQRSLAQGGQAYSAGDVRGSAPHRLYRARASRAYLGDRDRRIPVDFV